LLWLQMVELFKVIHLCVTEIFQVDYELHKYCSLLGDINKNIVSEVLANNLQIITGLYDILPKYFKRK
jgi:hypothetical protein